MSTLSSSFIPGDPLSSFTSQRRRWLQRRRKHYMEATNKYSAQLCEILESETKQKLKLLASNELDIQIPANLLPLRGITIERSAILFQIKLGQKISLIDSSENNEISQGFIIGISPSNVKIKLSKPIEPKPKPVIADADKDDKQPHGEDDEPVVDQQQASCCSERSELESEQTTIEEELNSITVAATEVTKNEPSNEENIIVTGDVDHDSGEADEQKLAMNDNDETPLNCRIKFNWCDILNRHECISNALNRFRKVSCSVPLHKCLLGIYSDHSDLIQEKARIMPFNELPEPRDKMQRLAIEQTMKKRISLIEGPAGCGKTTLAAYIACNMSSLKKQKVLICSPIQKTVSKLGHLLQSISGLSAVELPNKSLKLPRSGTRFHSATNIDSILEEANSTSPSAANDKRRQQQQKRHSACYLDKLVDDAIYAMACRRSRDYFDGHPVSVNYMSKLIQDDRQQNRRRSLNYFNERVAIEDAKSLAVHAHASRVVSSSSPWLRRKFEQKLLQRANIVCCNLLQAGSWQLDGLEFDLLIIDDVQCASEIECLVPIATRSIKQVCLLSDLRRDIRLPRRIERLSSFHSMNNNSSHNMNNHHQNPAKQINSSNNFLANNNHHHQNHRNHKAPKLGKTNKKGRSFSSQITSNSSFYTNKNSFYNSEYDTNGYGEEFIGPTDELGGLFERWLSLGLSAVALRYQYRAHESLSTFTNNLFYRRPPKDDPKTNRKLTREICCAFKRASDSFDWLPNKRCLTALFDEKAFGETLGESVTKILKNLIEIEQIDKSKIGIVFNRQQAFNSDGMDKSTIANIEAGTVLDFIGDEKDFFLVIGCSSNLESDDAVDEQQQSDLLSEETENTNGGAIDFLHSDNALNVALTRARLGLLIIADLNKQLSLIDRDEENLSSRQARGQGTQFCKSWRDMIEYYVANELVKR